MYLIAPDIENNGVITSPNGEILLAAGKTVELVDAVDPSLRVKFTAPDGEKAVNLGQIIAEGGKAGIYAGLISQKGLVSANSAVAQGGKIFFKSAQATNLEAGSQTTANGTAGGSVTVQTTGGDTIADSAVVSAIGSSGKGGDVQVLGNRVGLTGTTNVDASGRTGGGNVLVGGDYQGKNAAIQNSQVTYFGQDASLNASATENGDGGKVIVWADDTTRAYGTIVARGGASGGNGGFVETSGKNYLDANGAHVSTVAPNGKLGTWLLDPSNIYIAASQLNATNAGMTGTDISVDQYGGAPSFFQTGGAPIDSLLLVSTLQNALNGNTTNVRVDSASSYSASAAGNITVVDPVTWSTSRTLTLAADTGGIVINAPITAASGKLVLDSDSTISQSLAAILTLASLTTRSAGGQTCRQRTQSVISMVKTLVAVTSFLKTQSVQ